MLFSKNNITDICCGKSPRLSKIGMMNATSACILCIKAVIIIYY